MFAKFARLGQNGRAGRSSFEPDYSEEVPAGRTLAGHSARQDELLGNGISERTAQQGGATADERVRTIREIACTAMLRDPHAPLVLERAHLLADQIVTVRLRRALSRLILKRGGGMMLTGGKLARTDSLRRRSRLP